MLHAGAKVGAMHKSLSVWILGDQLMAPAEHPALRRALELGGPNGVRVVLVESLERLQRLPWQRKKLVLLLSALRHYAEELRAAGWTVEVVQAATMVQGLQAHVAAWRPERLITMAAAEYRGRRLQQERLAEWLGIAVEVLPNTQFLVGRHNPVPPGKAWIMEPFYRAQRKEYGLLLDAGEPVGGRWNFDEENRSPLPKAGIAAPPPPSVTPDAITARVMAEVEALPNGVGVVEGFDLPVTRVDADAAFDDFLRCRLPLFGRYEDAMSASNGVLFHSLLSPLLNLGLLDPLAMARAAEGEYNAGRAPLNSVEGFIRQVVGWREYIYHQYWAQMPELLDANAWGHTRPLPRFFWDGETDMGCLRTVIGRVIRTGYSHHIERLMVLCNFAMLAGIEPAAVHRWFLAFYIDAYEWVVAPNVIGMGLNADGDLARGGRTATKPYIASAAYINRMGDYCQGCRFNPKARTGPTACPFNTLYWDFLQRNERLLRANPRFGPAVLGLKHLSEKEREQVRQEASAFLAALEPYRNDGDV
jgi:deoxyribodipyrimidine photolyase-related protein